ncbi:MAG: DUF1906 domain-containing protein, partial [Solirubrobacterales bacterium]|nr:DUF1906 domain-containing protein [Solirubrobacterales bacterium]
AWSGSPYRAVGVYIGGANMACAQSNLTAGWVSEESAAGWHFIPTYVGLQAPHNSCGCAAIRAGQASQEGAAAAGDAVSHAAAVGIGRGNPIYFDMESYARGGANSAAVLTFLSAWTARLHADGYLSGVYSNADSGISDLVAARASGMTEPDNIWFADWNGARSVSSAFLPGGEWGGHRLHQYEGGHDESHGGVTINVDSSYLDGATAGAAAPPPPPAPLFPNGTYIQVEGSESVYEMAGGAPLFVSSQYWESIEAPLRVPTKIDQQEWASLDSVPVNGTFLQTSTGAVYRVAGGTPLPIANPGLLFTEMQPVTIDPWDIADMSSPEAHLSPQPLEGTVVEGLPSRTYWQFVGGGQRRLTSANPAAVQVEEAGLAAFAPIPCVVPRLHHLTLAQARRTLRRADCRLAAVPPSLLARRARVRRVVKETPTAHTTHPAGFAVSVTLR